ncbi:MAG: MBL fold metallo-hydrolase [Promethearchaeota archaeon]
MNNDFIQPLSDEFEIYFLQAERNGRYPYAHSLLVGDILIDTGISVPLIKRLKKEIDSINTVLLSHWHEDHVMGNRLFPNTKFLSHIKDKPIIEDINKFYEYYALKKGTSGGQLLKLLFDGLQIKNTRITDTITDGQIINSNKNPDIKLKVIHTPGHSAGHCSFYETNSKIAFLADIDLSRFVFYGAIDSDLIEFEKSIEKLKTLDIEIAVTSHIGVFKGRKQIKNKLDDYQLIIDKRDDRILERFSESKPVNVNDLMKQNLIYKRYSKTEAEYEYIAEKIMIQKHLEKLEKKNKKIKTIDQGYILV